MSAALEPLSAEGPPGPPGSDDIAAALPEAPEAAGAAGAALVHADSRLSFVPLTITPDGSGFLVGSSESGVFLALPEVGVVALRELQAGHTIAEAAVTTRRHAGQDVDVLDFAATLVTTGLVSAVDGVRRAGAPAIAGRTWLAGVRPELVRPFFSAPAWWFYGACFGLCLAVLAAYPSFWPTYEDFFFYPNPAVCVVSMTLAGIVLGACHECCHWLAARAAGVAARFSVSRRLFFPVFETDLSQLWSVPRRQRYSAFLAGMAFDTLVLAMSLGVRVLWSAGVLDPPPLVCRFLGAVVLTQVTSIGWQALVFLRTDLYAVLITALGCFNLYRVTYLTAIGRLRRLRPAEAAELAAAHPHDRQVARWFSWLCAAGVGWAAFVFVAYFIPGTLLLAGWLFGSLRGMSLRSAAFWEAGLIGTIAALQALLPLLIWTWQRRHRQGGVG